MDQNQHGSARGVGLPAQTNPPTQAIGPSNPSAYNGESQYVPPKYMYRQLQQDQMLQQKLKNFWAKQQKEIEETTDLKIHDLPLARVRKIMKCDEDVKMISAEAPLVLAKACEMFIQDLTTRAWANAENNNRKTLRKGDVSSAILRTDVFDFLVDIVPKDETVENALGMSMEMPVLDQNHPFPSPMGPTPDGQNHSPN